VKLDATPTQPATPSFQPLVEQGHDVFFRFRLQPDPGIEYLSPSVAELTGHPVEAFLADPGLFQSLVHPEDRPLLDLEALFAL